MLRVLSYAVRKLNTVAAYQNWLASRFSYGMNGILLHNDDLSILTAYLRCPPPPPPPTPHDTLPTPSSYCSCSWKLSAVFAFVAELFRLS